MNYDQSAEQTDPTQVSPPAPDQGVGQRITMWCKRLHLVRERCNEGPFKRMRESMDLARTGCDKAWLEADQYVTPIVRRHIRQAVDRTFARLPKMQAVRRPKIDTVLWDGSAEQIAQAVEMNALDMATYGMPNPEALALLEEVQAVQQQRKMLEKAGKTLEFLFNYYIEEPRPSFKVQMKQLLYRVRTCAVGYIELGFQRDLGRRPEWSAQMDDMSRRMAHLEMLMQEVQDPDGDVELQLEELKRAMEALQAEPEIISREGPIFDFPRATEVLVDPKCRHLRGFIGADWIARERYLTAKEIKEVYQHDVCDKGLKYDDKGAYDNGQPDLFVEAGDKEKFCVWTVYHKPDRTAFTLCDGYDDYLKPPAPPEAQVEGFWPIYALVRGDAEHEKELYPPSEVDDLRHAQLGYNQSRQGLREHRRANRPAYAARKGILDDEDKERLQNRPNNAIVELAAMSEQDDVNKVLQRIQPVPIDPALYDTGVYMEDVLRGAGTQEAVIGGASGATATEVAVSENASSAGSASDVDDLDEFLTEIARGTGQVMLRNLSIETVQEIVGAGAVWPEHTGDQLVKELSLTVKAGSTGRPNKAAELANRERAMPFLIQMPNLNWMPIAEDYLELLDIDVEGAILEGLPSLVAMNSAANGAQAQPGTGDPESDPNQQGGEGGDNAEQPAEAAPEGQPDFTAPQPGIAGR